MKNQLQQLLKQVLSDLGLQDLSVVITPTQDTSHGDYATNVAFQAAKKLGVNPIEAAKLIRKALSAKRSALVEKVEVAAPGFINFTLSSQTLLNHLTTEHNPSTGSGRRASSIFEGKKIMIEFTDPNPFKEFHIGHLYSNIVGESISRILEANGAEVRRVCYQGDVGLHVAKALWGLLQLSKEQRAKSKESDQEFLNKLESKSLNERANFLGEAYALGATKYEESDRAKQEIIEINKVVYELNNEKYSSSEAKRSREVQDDSSRQSSNNKEIAEMYTKGREWSLEYFEMIYARLGTKFVDYYFESEAGPRGVDLVKQYKDTVFEDSQGAIIFPGEKYARPQSPEATANGGQGLHTRVFINSLGLPTYEAKELALAVSKYEDYPFDSSIVITGNEIDEYFKVLLKALSLIQPEIAGKMKHLSHGMVRLADPSASSGRSVKMSSRTGNVKTGEWLLDEAVARAGVLAKREAQSGKGRGDSSVRGAHKGLLLEKGVSPEEELQVSEMVGIAAVKWALLRSGIGKDIEFSFDESVSFEGNSGPYLQYTYVRTQSVLTKSKVKSQKSKAEVSLSDLNYQLLTTNYPLNSEERRLLVLLCQYSDIVISAAERFSPSDVTTYLFELAQAFNLFYQKHQILRSHNVIPAKAGIQIPGQVGDDDDAVRDFRLALTTKVGQTIKDGLYLLGIKTPERM